MFNVELNDDGVEMARELFGVTPVLVYTRWANYTGTAVWRCNQYSTYSLIGEPTDARYQGLFDDGIFTEVVNDKTQWFDSPTRRLWALLKEKFPAAYEKRSGQSQARADYDQETMFVHGAMVTGGTAKKDAKGEWTIALPARAAPRKKFLGIF